MVWTCCDSEEGICELARGDLVIDPFGGALTTAKCCRDMGRRCIIIERDDEDKGYVEYGIERLTRMQPLFTM